MSNGAAEVNVEAILADPVMLAFLEQYGSKFRITALPQDVRDHREASHFYLYVEYRSPGKWAVCDMFRDVLSRTGNWRGERLPSARTEKFKEVTRFPLAEAFRLAQAEAAKMTVNNFDVEKITAHIRKWQADDARQEAEAKASRKAAKVDGKSAKKVGGEG